MPDRNHAVVCLPLLLLAVGCGDGSNASADSKSDRAPQPLVDINPDPRVVEVVLIASESETEYLRGTRAGIWAYRDGSVPGSIGQVPGPLLEAKRGDRVRVHYRSELPAETTVHWHGIQLPNASDGTPSSQVPVPPGGSFVYEFVAEDAGTFWYHPHMHADVLIERGLYGPVRILGEAEPTAAQDRVFVLDDVKLDGDGTLSKFTDPLDVMLGRQGNVLLVNGRERPSIEVAAGTRERWRFVNVANGRFFNLRFDRPLFVIGWDGGLVPHPYAVDTLLIAPGERYEVLVTFPTAERDRRPVLKTIHYDRGHNIPNPGPLDLLEVKVGPPPKLGSAPPEPELPVVWGDWRPLPVTSATASRTFELREEEKVPFPRFYINGEAFPHNTPVAGVPNAVEVWEIHNETEMDHPFHLHGMFFQVLDINGVPPRYQGWKDTVNVPREAKLRFAVRLGPPGNWMFHCHILEHAERGMMGELRISAPGTSPTPSPTHHP
ncbi:MAG TPA: multicopper oxidase family protein [Polyangia bacterium]